MSIRVNLEMAHGRARDDTEHHEMKKQELETGYYQSSQIKRLSITILASNSPKGVLLLRLIAYTIIELN